MYPPAYLLIVTRSQPQEHFPSWLSGSPQPQPHVPSPQSDFEKPGDGGSTTSLFSTALAACIRRVIDVPPVAVVS